MDNIKVAIRVRPMIAREQKMGFDSNWIIRDNTMAPMENGKIGTPYNFDRIFDQNKTTLDIFEEICKPVITGAVQGFHGTIFAYGQSSSGKTFTMSGSPEHPGIISLSIEDIFRQMKNTPDKEFLLRISYMEIYNERVSDLLSTEDKTIRIQEDMDRNIQLSGVCEELVMSPIDVHQFMRIGNDRKHMAETKQNDRSSRSHCIMRMIIESRETGDEDAVMVSHLNFVDLAGSEKAHENSGDRYKEGCAINKSLFMLGTVISKLSDGVGHQHIGYRDSKLTRILQNALGGNSKTAIIATITPASLEESHSTLRFASRAKTIKNQPHVNETLSDAALLKRSRMEILSLQQKINALESMDVLVEKEELQKKLEEKMEAERKQTETIEKLKQFIIKAGSDNDDESSYKKLKRRRETWCPGKAKGSLDIPGAGKFARDLNGKRMDVEFERPAIPKSFVTTRREDSMLPDISEISSLADISPPKDDSFLMEFPPTFSDFPPQSRKQVSFQSPNQDFESPPSKEYEKLSKDYKDLQDNYEKLLEVYEQKCRQTDEDQSYIQHELDYVKEHVMELEKETKLGSSKMVEELQLTLKQIQNEKNDLTDEVVLLQHRLSIQNRKVEECQRELTELRNKQSEKPTEVRGDIQNVKSQYEDEIKRLTSENEKLVADLSDIKNINEEMQHQHETSLEYYIIKIQELEEKMEESQGKWNSQMEKLCTLEEENKMIKNNLTETESKLSEMRDCYEKEVAKNQLQTKTDSANIESLNEMSLELSRYKQLVQEQVNRIEELEKEVVQLYIKLKEHSGVVGQRRSTADELSDILKEHCEDLENQLKEMEMEKNQLKEKLSSCLEVPRPRAAEELSVEVPRPSAAEELSVEVPRRSAADELSDLLKEHCDDLESRLKEIEKENTELKLKLETNLLMGNTQRQSIAGDLSGEELEIRLKEIELENTELKSKLETNILSGDIHVEVRLLKEKITSLQSENESLKSQSARQEEQIAILSEKFAHDSHSEMNRRSTADELTDVLREHCNDLEIRLREIEVENEELKQTVSRYTVALPENEKAHIEIIETEKKELRKEMILLRESNRMDQEKIKALQRELVSFGEKVRADSISECNRRSVEVELTDVYKEHCQDLETRLEELQRENSNLSAKVNKLTSDHEISQLHHQDLEAKLGVLEKENLELQNGILRNNGHSNLADELSEVNKGLLDEIEHDHSSDNVDLDDGTDSKLDSQSPESLGIKESKILELENELERLRLQLEDKLASEQCNVKIQEQEDEVQRLMKKSDTVLDDKSLRVQELEDELEKMKTELANAKENNSPSYCKLQQALKELQEEHCHCVNKLVTLEELQEEHSHCVNKLVTLEELREEHSHCVNKLVTLEELQEEHSHCVNKLVTLEELREEHSHCVNKLVTLEELREEHSHCVNKLVTEDKVFESQTDDALYLLKLQNQVSKLKLENQSLHDALRDVQTSSEMKQEVCLVDKQTSIELAQRCEDLTQKCDLLTEELEQFTQKYGILKENNVFLNVLKEELMDQITSLKENIHGDSSKQQYTSLLNKIEDLEIQNNCLIEEIGECELLKTQLSDVMKQLEESKVKDANIVELKCTIEKLEEEKMALCNQLQNRELSQGMMNQNTLEEDYRSGSEILERKIELLENENAVLLQKLAVGENTILQEKEDNVDRFKIHELESRIILLEEENKSLQGKLHPDNTSDLQIKILTEENQSLIKRLEECSTSEICHLKCKLGDIETEKNCFNDNVDDIRSIQLQELKCKIEVLEEENKCISEKLVNFDVMKIQEAECKIEVLEEENKMLLEKLDDLEGKNKILEEKNKNLSEVMDSCNDTKMQELENNIQVLERENKCLLEELDSKNNEIMLKIEEKNILSGKLQHENEVERKDFENKIEGLQAELSTLRNESDLGLFEKVQELELKIELIEEEKKSLLDKLEANEGYKCQELECKIEVLEEENKCLIEKLEESESTKQELECKIEVLEEENKGLCEKLEETEQRIEDNNSIIQKLQEDERLNKAGNSSAQVELESKIEVLTEELNAVKMEADTEKKSLYEKIEMSECKMEVLQEEIESLTKQIETLTKQIETLTKQIETLTKQIETSQFKLEEWECKAEVLQEENDLLCKKVENMVDKLQFEECKAKGLQGEVNALNLQLQENSNQTCKNQEAKITDLMAEITSLREHKVNLELELKESHMELSKAVAIHTKGSKKIKDLKDDLEILKATELILKNDNEKLLNEISMLQKSYQHLVESGRTKCEDLTKEVEILRNKLSDSITPDVLQAKLTEIDLIFQKKIQEKQNVIDHLNSTITKTNANIDQISEQHSQSENNRLELVQKLRTVEKCSKDLQDKVEKLTKDNEDLKEKLTELESNRPLSTSSMDESMSTKSKMENMDKTMKDKIVKLVVENNKLKDRNKKDSALIEWQKTSIQRLEEQLEKKDRESDLFDKLKSAEESQKKAEAEADKYYEKCCQEEAKVSDLLDDVDKKNKQIQELQEEIKNMESTGNYKKDGTEPVALKKKFAEIYNELQEAKRQITSLQRENGDRNLDIFHLKHNLEKQEFQYNKKIKAYEESVELYEQHIAKLKNEIRRVGTDQDDTMVNIKPMKKDTELAIGKASGAGGAVDHFNNLLLEEQNRKLLKHNSKLENKVKDLKEEIVKYQKEKKENVQLETKVAELREEEKRLKSQIAEHSARLPLESVNTTDSVKIEPRFKLPDSVKTEPMFKLPDRPGTRHNDNIEEQCKQQ